MIKILIDNEEVVSDSTLQIKEEMLSTSSTILKNCYPKAWEETKDYNSNYYFPKDYSKCKIIQEEEIDFEILGETTQEGTPTPDSPKPIINKTGTITETIGGLPYQFNLGEIELCKIGNYQDKIYKTKGINMLDISTLQSGYIAGNGTITNSSPLGEMYSDFIKVKSNTTYTFKIFKTDSSNANWFGVGEYTSNNVSNFIRRDTMTTTTQNYITFTTSETTNYIMVSARNLYEATQVQLQEGQATVYEPYESIGEWFVEKQIGKVVLDGSENWNIYGDNQTDVRGFYTSNEDRKHNLGISNYFVKYDGDIGYGGQLRINYPAISILQTYTKIAIEKTLANSVTDFKTWLSTNKPDVYYVLATPEYTEITDPTLLEQLNNVGEVLIFCGCVKNTGNISLNPRDPHYVDLQILDFKTLLSEGETLNYVITDKTIVEAINQVVSSISDYGFVVGNIELLTPNDKINAYSTLNKTAYDVFQYIADITQSKWTTRMIDENTIAIDFYDPTLMPQASPIESTQSYFEQNEIEDISFNYSTNDYRNKQIMTSDEVFANITQTETLIADGYRDSFMCQNKIGIIEKITVNGVEKTFATKSEEELGVSADFIYQPGEMTFNANTTYSAGAVIVITYYAIVKGREIVLNTTESTRVSNQIGRKGTISRYENRNDTTSSQELIKIGQSYIKYKGSAEITLKVISGKDLFNVGQIVNYDAPLEELSTDYMVKSKVIDMYLNAGEIFYTYELSSNFNSENAINYFDNQRAKNQGNIGEGETITRNIDLESIALIQFYDTDIEEIVVTNPTSLDFALDGVLI